MDKTIKIHEIVKYPDPILSKRGEPVTVFDEKLKTLLFRAGPLGQLQLANASEKLVTKKKDRRHHRRTNNEFTNGLGEFSGAVFFRLTTQQFEQR